MIAITSREDQKQVAGSELEIKTTTTNHYHTRRADFVAMVGRYVSHLLLRDKILSTAGTIKGGESQSQDRSRELLKKTENLLFRTENSIRVFKHSMILKVSIQTSNLTARSSFTATRVIPE